MATVVRGENGEPCESPIRILPMIIDNNSRIQVEDDTAFEVSVAHGEKVTITLSGKEELEFLAALTRRMAIRVNPPEPSPPQFERPTFGQETESTHR